MHLKVRIHYKFHLRLCKLLEFDQEYIKFNIIHLNSVEFDPTCIEFYPFKKKINNDKFDPASIEFTTIQQIGHFGKKIWNDVYP